MAIDFLIFGLLLISFCINLLALGAFWITPSLRTTANRFTINLLVINLFGCIILAPTLFLNTNVNVAAATAAAAYSEDSIEYYVKPGNHQMIVRHNGQLLQQQGVINSTTQDARTIETIYKCNSTYCKELTIAENSDTIVITELEEQQQQRQQADAAADPSIKPVLPDISMRSWTLDMTAALGALAVLLVVGDTWCAVTDPLRYHSRISGLKTWIFIALVWAIGMFFAALSAFRELDFESDTLLSKQKRFASTHLYYNISSANMIFELTFACLYFVVIILLPFGFVCGMYWRIFSEARENGLRMRQNGSSPLLQSALNLAQQQSAIASGGAQYAQNLCNERNSISSNSSAAALQLQMEQSVTPRRDSAAKVLLPTISDDVDDSGDEDDAQSNSEHLLPICNQNILLTLQAASGEIKRNYSARQLPLLCTSSQDFRETQRLQGVRQVHSTPNLRKYSELRMEQQEHLLHIVPQRLSLQQQHRHGQTAHVHALQIPAIHSQHHTKALSYMSSLRHRLSNASSLFKYREESRAARISILVVIMFLVSYLPYGLLVLLQSRIPAANFEQSTQLAVFMILLANLSSPFIFAYRNKRVRRGVKRLFGFEARCRERDLLQRQNSCSVRGSSYLGGRNTAAAQIRRNDSKVSQYSNGSCKYLTPQLSVQSNSAAAPVHTTLSLRPNKSCSTLVNFALTKQSVSEEADESSAGSSNNAAVPAEKRPVLQRGITIVEHIQLDSAPPAAKRSFLRMLFNTSTNEPTEV